MKKWFVLAVMVLFIPKRAMAQAIEETFFDKYLPIAKWFDSPITFGVVIGSALLFVLVSTMFIKYVKHQEEKVKEWGKDKDIHELINLLDSENPKNARYAFMYLRMMATLRHEKDNEEENIADSPVKRKKAEEDYIALFINRIKEQRKSGNKEINPYLIYLLEDLEALSAIPVLEQIAKGESKTAMIANHARNYLMMKDEEARESKA